MDMCDSYYYCNGCGSQVPDWKAHLVRWSLTGGSSSTMAYCDVCFPGKYDMEVEHFEDIPDWMQPEGWMLNPDPGVCLAIRRRLKITDGHCPCVPADTYNEDTKCPCKRYRDGEGCHCRLYVPEPQTLF